jgi:hypothetical protein
MLANHAANQQGCVLIACLRGGQSKARRVDRWVERDAAQGCRAGSSLRDRVRKKWRGPMIATRANEPILERCRRLVFLHP